jgi:hypothetical protein
MKTTTPRKSIFINDTQQPTIDDPTRWLDAILMNMKQRQFILTIDLVNRNVTLLYEYPSGRAVHHV